MPEKSQVGCRLRPIGPPAPITGSGRVPIWPAARSQQQKCAHYWPTSCTFGADGSQDLLQPVDNQHVSLSRALVQT